MRNWKEEAENATIFFMLLQILLYQFVDNLIIKDRKYSQTDKQTRDQTLNNKNHNIFEKTMGKRIISSLTINSNWL